MEEKDFQRIEQLIGNVVKTEVGKAVNAELGSVKEDLQAMRSDVGSLRKEMQTVRSDVGSLKEEMQTVRSDVGSLKEEMQIVRSDVGNVKEEVKTVREELGSFKKEIKEDFRLQVGILSKDFQHKLQLVAEGHQMLSEKMDRMRDELGNKVDTVTSDLAAHRADTEGHKRGYMVSEP
jgi:chromosome segregation ATPase